MYEMNFFIRYESLHVWSSRRFTYLITPSQVYSTNAFPWWRLRCLRGTSLPLPSPPICRHWLNTCVPSEIGTPRNADLQARINDLIRNNQVEAVSNGIRKHGTGTKGWWNTVNKIIGRESKALKYQLCYQPWGHKPVSLKWNNTIRLSGWNFWEMLSMKILVIGLVYFLELLVDCIFLKCESIMGTLKISLVNFTTLWQCHYFCMD